MEGGRRLTLHQFTLLATEPGPGLQSLVALYRSTIPTDLLTTRMCRATCPINCYRAGPTVPHGTLMYSTNLLITRPCTGPWSPVVMFQLHSLQAVSNYAHLLHILVGSYQPLWPCVVANIQCYQACFQGVSACHLQLLCAR